MFQIVLMHDITCATQELYISAASEVEARRKAHIPEGWICIQVFPCSNELPF